MKKAAILGLLIILIFTSVQTFAQLIQDKQKLICKTWKIKKVLIDNKKAKFKVINDHIAFGQDMKYLSYDSEDVNLVSSKKGLWKFNYNGTSIITDPNTDAEMDMKIIKLNDGILVYELNFKKAIWQVHLKPE